MVCLSKILPSLAFVAAACVTLAGGSPTTTSEHGVTHYDKRTDFKKRELVADVSFNTFLNPTITLITSQCLCIQGGVLTPASIASLTANVPLSVNLAAAVVVYLTTGGVINAAITAAQTRLGAITATCNYPTNAVPACSTYAGAVEQGTGTCYFTCAATFVNCGQFCILPTQACISGIPQRRDLGPASSLCPPGMSACYLANSASLSKAKSIAWECMDTHTDIEACGGCQFPQIGEVEGADCTELEGADEVTCKKGIYHAITCIRGYRLEGTECVADKGYKSFWVQHA